MTKDWYLHPTFKVNKDTGKVSISFATPKPEKEKPHEKKP